MTVNLPFGIWLRNDCQKDVNKTEVRFLYPELAEGFAQPCPRADNNLEGHIMRIVFIKSLHSGLSFP